MSSLLIVSLLPLLGLPCAMHALAADLPEVARSPVSTSSVAELGIAEVQDGDDVAANRARVIDGVLKALNDNYVFPEVALEMEQAVRAKQAAGAYDKLGAGQDLAGALTRDLRAVCHDLHLGVRYSKDVLNTDNAPPSAEDMELMQRAARFDNYGFKSIERLEGNIGYLRFDQFYSGEEAFDVATAAMSFLANTDALIVDLRTNGGGAPSMVAFLCSYLFDGESVHLNSLVEPRRNYSHQWWTLPKVPGKRFGGEKPVFVLTSRRTFSAAEEYTYNLQNLGRAVIVGQTTGGGAHPVDSVVVGEHFRVRVPFARALNPISKTNWEGTGITPDIEATSREALTVAQIEALTAILEGDVLPQQERQLLQRRRELEQEL